MGGEVCLKGVFFGKLRLYCFVVILGEIKWVLVLEFIFLFLFRLGLDLWVIVCCFWIGEVCVGFDLYF